MTALNTFRLKVPWWVSIALGDSTPFRDIHITKGYGSGGTYGAAMWHLELAFGENKNADVSWVVAPTFAQIEDPIISTLVEVLRTHYGMDAGVDYVLNISGRPKIVLPNGHTIRFKSAKNPHTLVAENISHVWCTEPGLYAELVFERLTGRVRHPKAKRHQRLFEGTPEGMTAWEKLANFPEGVDEDNNRRRIIVETADNKRLPAGFLPKLIASLKHDAAKLISYTLGLFAPFVRGTAYWDFNYARDTVESWLKSVHSPLLLSFDFNNWPLAWVCQQKFHKEVLHFRREFYVQHGESDGKARGLLDAVADFIVQYPPEKFANTEIHLYGDRQGYSGSYKVEDNDFKSILQMLRSRYNSVSLKAAEVNPRIKERLEQHNKLFAYERLKVTRNCVNTIRSFQETRLKQGQWEFEKPPNDSVTHWGDASGYVNFALTKGQDFEKPSTKKIHGVNAS